MAEPAPDPSRPRRSGRLRRWLLRLLGEEKPFEPDTTSPAPVLPVTATANDTVPVVFTTPAKGDAYHFSVTADLCFCATGTLSVTRLNEKIQARIPDLTAEIKAAARPVAREYPPFRPGAAEPRIAEAVQRAVSHALAGTPDEDGAALECTARVRVDMEQEILEMQRLAVAEQVKFEARYEQSEQAAQRLGELRDVWARFIGDGLPDWTTPYAVLMAQQPHQAAVTLFKMREDRKNEAAQLVDTVAAVSAGHERMDLLEFALATDRALSRTYELLGIAPPVKMPGSAFEGDDEREGAGAA